MFALGDTADHADPKAAPLPVALAWVFAIHDNQEGSPRGKVYLSVGGRRELVEADAQYQFQVVSRAEYHDHAVPSGALCACSGWWAGGGEDLYVVRRGNRLKVYRRWLDEESGIFPYHLLRTFRVTTSSTDSR